MPIHSHLQMQAHQHGLLVGAILATFILATWRISGQTHCMCSVFHIYVCTFQLCLTYCRTVADPATKQHVDLQNFRYTYRLGHRLMNGTRIWSKSYSFKASPYPGQDSLQRVVIFGDMGKVFFSLPFLSYFTQITIWYFHLQVYWIFFWQISSGGSRWFQRVQQLPTRITEHYLPDHQRPGKHWHGGPHWGHLLR